MSWNIVLRPVPGDAGHLRECMAPKQSCEACGDALPVLFKGDPRSAETWFWETCEVCLEPMCLDCTDEISETDGYTTDQGGDYMVGGRICTDCISDQMRKAARKD